MRKERLILGIGCFLLTLNMFEQTVQFTSRILDTVQVYPSMGKFREKYVERVAYYSALKPVDNPAFARIKGVEIRNGPIVGIALNWLLPNTEDHTGGFCGVEFSTNGSHSTVEDVYVRLANSLDQTPTRKRQTIHYFSFPAYKLDKRTTETPEELDVYSIRIRMD